MKKVFFFLIFLSFISRSNTQDIGKFSAGGTEPFWNIKFSENEVVFENMGDDAIRFKYVGPFKAEGLLKEYISIYYLTEDKNTFIIIKDGEGRCTNMMSDEFFPYEVFLKIKDKFFYGCGSYEK